MSSVIDLYERLSTAEDEKARARIVAEAFEALDSRYPHLSETATRTDLSETELRLTKEIEQVRAETEKVRADLSETELRLTKEIEQVRADLKVDIEQVRADLKVEIEQVRVEVEKVRGDVRVEIARSHAAWLKWSFLFWLTQFSAILLLLWRVWPQG